ncbi:inactive dipeptidyl peptidase 10-like isoform X1 [Portunus trituberculatus]|uniref:inactive dipeptidyl peptidase 10-like isoform X1 n=1 Tax=Portunus trituberculatus TaxID=210409 RepID=UPI001E1CB948|nr:inactive dipeptidyl peptidase 10-like isoform X1 [Portunus trituberculatus]XP_045111883.1 inactive dipeptidyl peptidase 10-like isoform X1 [Portunus trituberculatus]XP_045111884.1 inactive dipeptidyl peptidase 10-like isoform X1 [Portunus trituberculatus]XP_045111885.1 inactive dipeptidyl peptidase 10-like isoform X1 [Portunus trituberculatus]XP_045111886.1 inactive dipeptidyl peptidase 10-like isoform X1 [Portunus trituberculatus]
MTSGTDAKSKRDRRKSTANPNNPQAAVEEELASSNPNQRNWRGIIIAVLVICFVLGMIVTSVLLLTPPDDGPRVKGRRFELEDILGDDFKIPTFNGTWVTDHELVFRDPAGGLSVFDAETLTSRLLVSNITFRQLNVAHFSASPDLRYVLLVEHGQKVFRHSFKAKYHIFNCQTQHINKLSPKPEERDHPLLLLARWAPRGTSLVMVDEHYNIFYRPSADKETVHRLTHTGRPGVIYNGVPDWVYEEEILGTNSALWFSPDGAKLAYASLNDSLVETVAIPQYVSNHQQYPTMRNLRYPKPGQENPKVTLWVIDLINLRSIKPRDLKPPNVVKDQLVHSAVWDHYFTALSWVDNEEVSVVWMNRAQNISVITICSPPLYFCDTTHREQSGGRGWVELYDAPIFSTDGQSFLVRLPVRNGDQGEFKHVNLYNVRMHQVIPITHGAYEVTEILGWDQNNNYIYYIATMEGKPGDRHLFRTSDVTSPMMLMPDCLSCLEADNNTDTCLYNRAHFSKDFSYYVLECQGPDVPRIYLFSTWSNQLIYTLDNYSELRERVEEMALPKTQTFRVELESDNPYTYHVQLLLPPGFRDDEITQYPMVVHAYAAPGSQAVTSKMQFSWGTYLASKKKMIYAMIDGRGSGFQGDKIKREIYHELGGKEVKDQVAVAKYLRDNLHFVHPRKITIWGWSYGGYVTTMALARDADNVFSCGMAVAPVARWEHYDSVYTERYMGSPRVYPGSNYKGYEAADATKVVGNLKGKMFLLVHGTADDNVHYHHSMMLAKALVDEDVLFQQMTYADENHGLTNVKEHLYRTLDKFLADCFRPTIPELYFLIKKKKKDVEEIGYL